MDMVVRETLRLCSPVQVGGNSRSLISAVPGQKHHQFGRCSMFHPINSELQPAQRTKPTEWSNFILFPPEPLAAGSWEVSQRGLTQPVQCGQYTLLPGGHSGRGRTKQVWMRIEQTGGVSSVKQVGDDN